jgi:hypothetical protein
VLAAAFATLCASVFVLASFVWIWWGIEPDDDQRSRGVNALWAAHTWVGDAHSDAEYRAFAELVQRNEISDVFFHAGPLGADGRVPDERVQYVAPLLEAMDRYAPGVRTQAYLGQIEERGGGTLDLDDDLVRAGIVETAERFLAAGFDGIHYDIEPIYPGDASFLDLLDRTGRLTREHGAVLSVALEQMEAVRGAQRVVGLVWPAYHDPTEGFLKEVAARVDQVAIMTYDTALPADWLFGAHMAWQTERVVEAIGHDATVFMGVPTYDEGATGRFYSWAENVDSGIRGVRKGLARVEGDRTGNVGIAIFAEWTTTDDEWGAYHSAWIED